MFIGNSFTTVAGIETVSVTPFIEPIWSPAK